MAQSRRPRLCRACGKLIGSENTACPYCGRRESPFDGAFDGMFRHWEFARILLVANVALFVVLLGLTVRQFGQWPPFPYRISPDILYRFGLLHPDFVLQGELWRLINPVFLHLDLIHLLFNGFAIYSIGPDVESGYGKERFIVIYMGGGIVGNLGSLLFGIGGGGASGALFGLVGAYVAFGLRSRQSEVTKRAVGWAVTLFLIGLVMGSRINHVAHFFGFFGGLGTAYALGIHDLKTFLARRALRIGAVVLVVLVPVCFAIALYRGFA